MHTLDQMLASDTKCSSDADLVPREAIFQLAAAVEALERPTILQLRALGLGLPQQLRPVRSCCPIAYLKRTASTMDFARDLMKSREQTRFVVIAQEQTAGRGRQGRSWFSPPGAGAYVTFVLCREHGSDNWAGLSLAAGIAVLNAIFTLCGAEAASSIGLKWPNDVVQIDSASGSLKKIGGILVDVSTMPGTTNTSSSLSIGIGLNLLPIAFPPDIPGIALGDIASRPIIFEEALAALLVSISAVVDLFLERRFEAFHDIYEKFFVLRGKSISLNEPSGEKINAIALGINHAGGLRISETKESASIGAHTTETRVVYSGEIV